MVQDMEQDPLGMENIQVNGKDDRPNGYGTFENKKRCCHFENLKWELQKKIDEGIFTKKI